MARWISLNSIKKKNLFFVSVCFKFVSVIGKLLILQCFTAIGLVVVVQRIALYREKHYGFHVRSQKILISVDWKGYIFGITKLLKIHLFLRWIVIEFISGMSFCSLDSAERAITHMVMWWWWRVFLSQLYLIAIETHKIVFKQWGLPLSLSDSCVTPFITIHKYTGKYYCILEFSIFIVIQNVIHRNYFILNIKNIETEKNLWVVKC